MLLWYRGVNSGWIQSFNPRGTEFERMWTCDNGPSWKRVYLTFICQPQTENNSPPSAKKDTLLLKISMLRFSTKNIFLMTNTREEDWKIRNVTASRSQEFYFYCLSTTAIAFNDFAPSKVEKIYILWGRWKFLFSYIFILEWHAIKTNKKQMLWLPQWLLLQTEMKMMLF